MKQPARRRALAGLAALAPGLARPARAMTDFSRYAWLEVTRGRPVWKGRVRLELPESVENGNSVPFRVSVEGPRTGPERVVKIHVISEINPYPLLFTWELRAPEVPAEFATRIRLAGTQQLHAIAETARGELWIDSRMAEVAVPACFDAS